MAASFAIAMSSTGCAPVVDAAVAAVVAAEVLLSLPHAAAAIATPPTASTRPPLAPRVSNWARLLCTGRSSTESGFVFSLMRGTGSRRPSPAWR